MFDEDEDNNKLYAKPDKIPETITKKLWVKYGIGKYNSEKIFIEDSPPYESEDFGSVVLLEHTITLAIPKCEVDVKEQMLIILQNEKNRILAENHKRLCEINQKISTLLAIEYKPEDESEEK